MQNEVHEIVGGREDDGHAQRRNGAELLEDTSCESRLSKPCSQWGGLQNSPVTQKTTGDDERIETFSITSYRTYSRTAHPNPCSVHIRPNHRPSTPRYATPISTSPSTSGPFATAAPPPRSCQSARRASAASRMDAIFARMTLIDSGKSDSGVYGPSDSTLTVDSWSVSIHRGKKRFKVRKRSERERKRYMKRKVAAVAEERKEGTRTDKTVAYPLQLHTPFKLLMPQYLA